MEGKPIWGDPESETALEYDPRAGEYVPVRPRRPFPRIQAVLFTLTLLSTALVGGVAYSIALIAILLTHEMGHYLTARRHRIPATLPFFLPMPFTIIGTFGAVIKMDGRRATRKQLFDVGVAGPLAGTVVAIPITLIGIRLSRVVPDNFGAGEILSLGDSLLFLLLSRVANGPIPEGQTLLLHPIAFAGWVGLFVTALNLLPIGQLDGGHVLYGLLGRRAAPISLAVLGAFALLAVVYSPGWLLLVFLLLYFGYRHPPTLGEEVGLDTRRKWIGVLTLILFIAAFTPIPISFSIP
ncbi:MAG: site-2 protease family protein [Candidatus Eisenbacteria bacterium]|nr:site-2 protease family protein [Candidatus Eisenbacteria bacterium]